MKKYLITWAAFFFNLIFAGLLVIRPQEVIKPELNFGPRQSQEVIDSTSQALPQPDWREIPSSIKPTPIEVEIAKIMEELIDEFDLYGVITGISPLDSAQSGESGVYKIFVSANKQMTLQLMSFIYEALVIHVEHFSQIGIPLATTQNADKNPGLIHNVLLPVGNKIGSILLKGALPPAGTDSDEKFAHNILTQLSVLVRLIEKNKGQLIDAFYIDVVHTGGTRTESKARALKQFKQKARYELQRLYFLFSDIRNTQAEQATLYLGQDFDLYKGMLFELVQPEQIINASADEVYIIPGGRAGFAAISEIFQDSSNSQIVRQWRPLHDEIYAVEYPRLIYALQANFYPPITESYWRSELQFHFNPLGIMDWGMGLQGIRITDSYGEENWGFGFSGFALWRIFNRPQYNLGTKLGIDLDFPGKKDALGKSVRASLFSGYLGIIAEWFLTPHTDIVINAGYHFGIKSEDWYYGNNDVSINATWSDDPPTVNTNGFLLAIGYKFMLF